MIVTTDLVNNICHDTGAAPDLVGAILSLASAKDPFRWRQMETAPRDGTVIEVFIPAPPELYVDFCPIVPAWWCRQRGEWRGANKQSYPFARKRDRPVCWRYPELPADLKGFEPDDLNNFRSKAT